MRRAWQIAMQGYFVRVALCMGFPVKCGAGASRTSFQALFGAIMHATAPAP